MNATTADFEIEYGATPPAQVADAMFTILPCRRSIIPGTTSCARWNVASTWTSNISW